MNLDRSAATPLALGAALIVLVAGTLVGFRLLTASAEPVVDAGAQCEERVVAAGEEVTPNLVKLDVYNASRRAGLANRVGINLQRRGFLAGEVGNSASEVTPRTVAILTDDPEDPRVKLVASHFSKVRIDPPDVPINDDSVTVIVGDDYEKLGTDTRSVVSDRELDLCLPAPLDPAA